MMDNKPDTELDAELAAFFDAAKDVDNTPNTAFLDAVVMDAVNQTKERAKPLRQAGLSTLRWRGLLRNIGGWQSATALVASAFLGITAGYAAPSALDYFDSGQMTAETFTDDNFSVASDIEILFDEN